MEVHQTAFLHGAALACAVALAMTGCDSPPAANPSSMSLTTAAAAPPAGTTVGTEIDDSVVTTRVKSALLADKDVKSFDIKVETRKGQVQLSGFVDTRTRIDYAIALTSKVEGVKAVENGMKVKEGRMTVGNVLDDGIVTARVKSALLADPDVKSFDIAVVTRKGEVQLSGYVDNRAQMGRAMDVAGTVDGVTRVGNEMSVKK